MYVTPSLIVLPHTGLHMKPKSIELSTKKHVS